MRRFTIQATVELQSHIGVCDVHINYDSPSDWYIESISNKWGAESTGDFISEKAWKDIESEVTEYVNSQPNSNEE